MVDMLNDDAQQLADYMTTLSRQAYHQDWIQHVEFVLWHAIVQGPIRYGHLDISDEHIEHLRFLSDQCGGWVFYHRSAGPCWVPLIEWQDIYASKFDPVHL